MALVFPTITGIGQTYNYNGVTYTWDGTKWAAGIVNTSVDLASAQTVGGTKTFSSNVYAPNIICGNGSGNVALSINDGYGNANVAFNHFAGIPDNTIGAGLGSSARITANVDSATGGLTFAVGNAVTAGTAVGLTNQLTLSTTALTSTVDITAPNFIGTASTAKTLYGNPIYISPTNPNTLNSAFSIAADGGDMWINYRGYNDAFTYFRDFRVGNGKGTAIATFIGSTGSLTVSGTFTSSSVASLQFGGSAASGFYVDTTNIAIRATTATGGIYMQSTGGGTTYGYFNSNGFNGSVNGTATNSYNVTGTAGTLGYCVASAGISYGGAGGPQIMGSTTNASMLTFHRAGAYAVNFGIDTDNILKIGGFSAGAASYPIYHAANPQPTCTNQSGGTVSATTGSFSGALFTNSYFMAADQVRSGNGNGVLGVDGNVYSSWIGDWASNWCGRVNRFHGTYYLNTAGWSQFTGIHDQNNTSYYIDMDGTSNTNTFNIQNSTVASYLGIAGAGISYTGAAAFTGKGANMIGFTWASPHITASVDNVAALVLANVSDYRLKTNIVDLKSVLLSIQKIRTVTYDAVEFDGTLNNTSHVGVIAHEISEIFPELVSGDKDGVDKDGNPQYQSVYYGGFAPYLIKAIQEQQEIITTQQKSIDILIDLVDNLTNRISMLE